MLDYRTDCDIEKMSLKGAATWPSFPSECGVLSVRAYPPFRGRAVSRGCRTQGCDGAGSASNIRMWIVIIYPLLT